jgi:iron complex outermembrane receptor protein
MYKPVFNKREVSHFTHFQRKGYSLFACLGREVLIGTLTVATLTHASAETKATEAQPADSCTASKEVMLDGISITGSRAPLALGQAARMVTVLDREDIACAPVQSVNDLLKYVAGVDVRQRGALGTQTDISVRGGTPEQITLLLNGINICDPQSGHNTMELPVDITEIERIEVLEGPAGRVFGTSSLLGAINIVTRPARKSSADAHIEGGSYGYMKGGGRVNMKSGRTNNQLSAGYARSDGYSRSKAGNLNTDYSGAKAFYQGEYYDGSVRINWHAGIADKGCGSSTFYASQKWQADNQYEHTTKIYTAVQAETNSGGFHFRPSIYWNQNRDRYEGYRGEAEKMKYNYNRCDVYGLNLNSYFDWAAGRTAVGAELRNEDLVSGNLGETLPRTHHIAGTDRDYTLGVNRTNISAHIEHNILLKRFTLSAGFVTVKNTWSNMNFSIYPGVDASYRIGQHWKAYASYNTSLRMPSFTEMYYKLHGHKADPHLKPEEMQAMELGIKYLAPAMQGRLSVYRHHGRNMIDWIMDTSKGSEAEWQSVNHTKINSTGIEAAIDANLKRLLPSMQWLKSISATYSYIQQDKDLEEGIMSQYALEYLKHKFVASMQFCLWRQLDLGVNYRFQDRIGTYIDFAGQTCTYRPYALWDARLSWNAPHYKLYAEANNLMNKKDYADYGNIVQPGTWITVGAAWHFNL